MIEKTKECPHCKYNCPKELYEEHLRLCDQTPKQKKKTNKYFDKQLKITGKFILIGIISFVIFLILLGTTLETLMWISLIAYIVSALFVRINTLIMTHRADKGGWFIFILFFGMLASLIFYINEWSKE